MTSSSWSVKKSRRPKLGNGRHLPPPKRSSSWLWPWQARKKCAMVALCGFSSIFMSVPGVDGTEVSLWWAVVVICSQFPEEVPGCREGPESVLGTSESHCWFATAWMLEIPAFALRASPVCFQTSSGVSLWNSYLLIYCVFVFVCG